jgi:hypothetical protein
MLDDTAVDEWGCPLRLSWTLCVCSNFYGCADFTAEEQNKRIRGRRRRRPPPLSSKKNKDNPRRAVARVSLKRVSLSAVFAAKTLAPHICLFFFFFLFYLVFIVPKVLFVAVTTSFAIPPKSSKSFFFLFCHRVSRSPPLGVIRYAQKDETQLEPGAYACLDKKIWEKKIRIKFVGWSLKAILLFFRLEF